MALMEDLLVIGIIAVVGYYLITSGTLDDIIKNLGGGGGLNFGLAPPTGGGIGGGFSRGGSCPGGQSCKFDGQDRWECENVPHAAYEATWCGTVPDPKDTLSIKMWGQKHSDGTCCWCILEVDQKNGHFWMRGEGPHPEYTDSLKDGGDMGPLTKDSCVKAVIRPGSNGAHVEGYGLVNGQWKQFISWDGQCGANKKSSKPVKPQQVAFRFDVSGVKTKCATVKPLGGGGGNGGIEQVGKEEEDEESKYVRAYYANMFPLRSEMDRIGYH
jgi:hypothetical protein